MRTVFPDAHEPDHTKSTEWNDRSLAFVDSFIGSDITGTIMRLEAARQITPAAADQLHEKVREMFRDLCRFSNRVRLVGMIQPTAN